MEKTSTNGQSETAETPQGSKDRLARASEALIFASDETVTAARIADVFAEVSGLEPNEAAVAEAIETLNENYDAEGRAFRIEAWAGGYRMATREEWAPFVRTLLAGPRRERLSRSLLETLAVVAYRQPVTRPEVDFIRGVSTDYALRKLMELNLVDVEGRADSMGRPLLYATTDHFLGEFGFADLDDLPTMREVEELLDDPNFNQERARLLKLRREEAVEEGEAGESEDADDSE